MVMEPLIPTLMPISQAAVTYIRYNQDNINKIAQTLGVDPLTISLSIAREIDRDYNAGIFVSAKMRQ